MNTPAQKPASSSEPMRLWKSATPIQDARLKFGPKELVESFAKTADVSILGEVAKHSSSLVEKPLSGMEVMIKAIELATPGYGGKWKRIHALDSFFLDKFRSGSLRCFAFEKPRSLNSTPVEVPAEQWSTSPDWDAGEYKAHGMHFIQLRVLEASAVENLQNEIEKPTLGRPGISNHVTAAFAHLQGAGKIDPKSSAKSHYQMVRSWIATNHPELKLLKDKPTDEGIRQHFAPLFNELKKNSKQ